jgi:predicted phage-related endonuclease
MAEDKTFELLTKMYTEFSDKFEKLEKGQKSLEKDVLRIETKLYEDSKTLYDGYQMTYEAVTEIKNDVKAVRSTVENHDLELIAVKSGRNIQE